MSPTGVVSQFSRKKLLCECGNVLEYGDVQQNCDFPQYCTLVCNECSTKHRIVLDGTLDNLVGASLLKF
jgi:hypothetical protein